MRNSSISPPTVLTLATLLCTYLIWHVYISYESISSLPLTKWLWHSRYAFSRSNEYPVKVFHPAYNLDQSSQQNFLATKKKEQNPLMQLECKVQNHRKVMPEWRSSQPFELQILFKSFRDPQFQSNHVYPKSNLAPIKFNIETFEPYMILKTWQGLLRNRRF